MDCCAWPRHSARIHTVAAAVARLDDAVEAAPATDALCDGVVAARVLAAGAGAARVTQDLEDDAHLAVAVVVEAVAVEVTRLHVMEEGDHALEGGVDISNALEIVVPAHVPLAEDVARRRRLCLDAHPRHLYPDAHHPHLCLDGRLHRPLAIDELAHVHAALVLGDIIRSDSRRADVDAVVDGFRIVGTLTAVITAGVRVPNGV